MTPEQPAVLLVADRTLSADYRVLFEAVFATTQTTRVPPFLMRHLLAPPLPLTPTGRAAVAPLGLRRIESALIDQGPLGPADVACVTPETLPRFLGPWVKLVAVSSSDPLGGGMSNTTTSAWTPGELYTRRWTRELLESLRMARKRHPFRLLVGGAGAWQWRRHPGLLDRFEIDTVFEGYFESTGPGLFRDMLEGRPAPRFAGDPSDPAAAAVRPIRGPSMLGMLELSRGCGKGCGFCAMAPLPMAHLEPATILADLHTNAQAGLVSAVSSSEDFFRYGGAGPRVNPGALLALLAAFRQEPALRFLQVDHANVSSLLQFSLEELREVRRLLAWPGSARYLWVNVGVETASSRLLAEHCPAKALPFRIEDWEHLVREAAERLDAAGFFPVFSLVLGLPGETPDDIARTRGLVEDLARRPCLVFPVFYEPVRQDQADAAFRLDRMQPGHLDLFRACYEINFRWVPRLYRDNQRAGGVPLAKRALLQVLGKAEIVLWRHAFRRAADRI